MVEFETGSGGDDLEFAIGSVGKGLARVGVIRGVTEEKDSFPGGVRNGWVDEREEGVRDFGKPGLVEDWGVVVRDDGAFELHGWL